MKEIIGIGNALVDALYLIENEDIIKELGLEKGGMHLIGENIFEQVCERMRAAKRERRLAVRPATRFWPWHSWGRRSV